MSESALLLAEKEGVVRITLNRPRKRNALTRELLAGLRQALRDAAARAELRVLILNAAGPVFCAGMDLAQMQETAGRADATAVWQADAEAYRDVVAELFSCRVPTVAVVQGPTVAGGLGLVLACDLVVAAKGATFALPEMKRGITAAMVTPLLLHRIGAGGASPLLLAGEQINAADALRLGICHRVVAADELAPAVNALVDSILTGSTAAVVAMKEQLIRCAPINVREQLDRAVSVSARSRETADAREGLQAFLEKRRPAWHPHG